MKQLAEQIADHFKDMDVEANARAIEADAGQPLEGIREALADLKAGNLGRVTKPEQILIRSARRKTGMSQQEFAQAISTPVATLQDWEQGRFPPPGSAISLAKLIMNHPNLITELAA